MLCLGSHESLPLAPYALISEVAQVSLMLTYRGRELLFQYRNVFRSQFPVLVSLNINEGWKH